jgi:UDP-N-acetylmuramate--alanine ligase
VIEEVDWGELRVRIPGVHNLVNALGATAAALQAGATVDACRAALAKFTGVGRRFEVLGEVDGMTIIDDYAHHPTEITATLAAARAAYPGRRLVAVFQPHLYSRTRDFADGFVRALEPADVVVMIDIYPAREDPIPGVTSGTIAGPLRERKGKDAVFELAKDEILGKLPGMTRSGDVVLLMGAGDIGDEAREFAVRLGARIGGSHPLTPAK